MSYSDQIATFLVETDDTDYVNKHRSFMVLVGQVLDAMAAQVANSAALNASAAWAALFGSSLSIVGASSYGCSGSGATLTVAAGFAYLPSAARVVSADDPVDLDFTGLAAATYYVVLDQLGQASRSDSATDAVYSVVWDGSAFGTITLLAEVVWGAADQLDAQSSAPLALDFDTMASRFEASELSQTAQLGVNVASGDVTLTQAQAMAAVALHVTGAPGAARSITVPDTAKLYLVRNDATGGQTLTIKTAAGAGASFQDGAAGLVYCDGTDVVEITNAGGSAPYDVYADRDGLPGDGASFMAVTFLRPVSFPADLAGSLFGADGAATGDAVFDVQKEGSSVGSITYGDGTATGTASVSGGVSFAAGETLRVVAPSPQNSTLSGVRMSFKGTRAS